MATGGVFLALNIIVLFLASYMPGVELTLYAISSFFVAFVIIESSVKGGLLFYASSLILAFVLVPNKAAVLLFGIFFGIYGIIKYTIEKTGKLPFLFEMTLKILFFNLSFGAGIYFFRELILGAIDLPEIGNILIILGAQIFFVGYDYIFTLVIGFYLKKRVLLKY